MLNNGILGQARLCMRVLETEMMRSGFKFSRLQDKQDSFVGKSKAKKSHTVKRERSLFCNSYADSEVAKLASPQKHQNFI